MNDDPSLLLFYIRFALSVFIYSTQAHNMFIRLYMIFSLPERPAVWDIRVNSLKRITTSLYIVVGLASTEFELNANDRAEGVNWYYSQRSFSQRCLLQSLRYYEHLRDSCSDPFICIYMLSLASAIFVILGAAFFLFLI